MNMRGGVVETLKVWGIQLDIKRVDKVHVPAYKGVMQYKYAQVAEGDGEKP